MRFELPLQPLFKALCDELGISFDMFPGPTDDRIPNGEPLATDEQNPRTGQNLGPYELLKLGVYRMFGRSPYVDPSDGKVKLSAQDNAWLASLNDVDGTFERLRQEAVLGAATGQQATQEWLYLHSFWNAMASCLSLRAVRRIQDFGTFYHLFETNPNAVEWGIFWLRLFKLADNEQLSTIPAGVASVTQRLQAVLERDFRDSVTLLTQHQVTAIRAEHDGSRVIAEVVDKTGEPTTREFEADHLVLALPQQPLRPLSERFPLQIQTDIEGVIGFTLLKVFTVVRTPPWWNTAPQPQKGARLVPTREIHYFPTGQLQENMLVLLYMDDHAANFWQVYLSDPSHHDRAEINANPALRSRLVSSLVDMYTIWADEAAEDSSQARLEVHREDDDWTVVREAIAQNLPEILPPGFMGDTARTARRQILLNSTQDLTDFVASTMGDYAIRDWSRSPFGAGCHAWGRGARSWEIRERLRGFSLAGDGGAPNVHICGEAYSDYQGFIEGSLRSAQAAVASILEAG